MSSVVLDNLLSLSADDIRSRVISEGPSVVPGNSHCGDLDGGGGGGGGGGISKTENAVSAPPMRSSMIAIWLSMAASATR